MTDRDKRSVVRLVCNSQVKSALEVAKRFDREKSRKVSAEATRKILRQDGLKAVKRVKTPSLTSDEWCARPSWGKEHQNRTMDDWKQVTCSEETKVNLFYSDGTEYVCVECSNNSD